MKPAWNMHHNSVELNYFVCHIHVVTYNKCIAMQCKSDSQKYTDCKLYVSVLTGIQPISIYIQNIKSKSLRWHLRTLCMTSKISKATCYRTAEKSKEMKSIREKKKWNLYTAQHQKHIYKHRKWKRDSLLTRNYLLKDSSSLSVATSIQQTKQRNVKCLKWNINCQKGT